MSLWQEFWGLWPSAGAFLWTSSAVPMSGLDSLMGVGLYSTAVMQGPASTPSLTP